MHIHFVCSGNAYRSRLAEAYLKSKLKEKKITVSSSGIAVDKHRFGNGPICWYAMRLMKRNELIPYMSWHENQTPKNALENVDILICMGKIHMEYCRKELGYKKPIEVWNIPDLNEMDGFIPSTVPGIETDINHINLTKKAFAEIKKKVDELFKRF